MNFIPDDILCLIPAKSCSVRLPGKNFRCLKNIPLVDHSILFALSIAQPDQVVFASDNKNELSRIVREYKIRSYYRSAACCEFGSTQGDVVREMFNEVSDSYLRNFKRILLLQPTSPFRDPVDFYNLVEKSNQHEVSRPLTLIAKSDGITSTVVRRDPNSLIFNDDQGGYVVTGSGYLCSIEHILNGAEFYASGQTEAVYCESQFVDIDTPDDWSRAELMVEQRSTQ